MSTELNHVVQSMSQVSIPQEILNKVDMNNLLKGFSDDYKKLDDLKAQAGSKFEDLKKAATDTLNKLKGDTNDSDKT